MREDPQKKRPFSAFAADSSAKSLAFSQSEGNMEIISIQRILCPTDLSTESDEALRYAVALTRAYDAKLLLLHCTKSRSGESEESRHLSVSTAREFQEALAAHLGLAELCDLKWQALAIDNVQDIGPYTGPSECFGEAEGMTATSDSRLFCQIPRLCGLSATSDAAA